MATIEAMDSNPRNLIILDAKTQQLIEGVEAIDFSWKPQDLLTITITRYGQTHSYYVSHAEISLDYEDMISDEDKQTR